VTVCCLVQIMPAGWPAGYRLRHCGNDCQSLPGPERDQLREAVGACAGGRLRARQDCHRQAHCCPQGSALQGLTKPLDSSNCFKSSCGSIQSQAELFGKGGSYFNASKRSELNDAICRNDGRRSVVSGGSLSSDVACMTSTFTAFKLTVHWNQYASGRRVSNQMHFPSHVLLLVSGRC
jgi:hypothetical protein